MGATKYLTRRGLVCGDFCAILVRVWNPARRMHAQCVYEWQFCHGADGSPARIRQYLTNPEVHV